MRARADRREDSVRCRRRHSVLWNVAEMSIVSNGMIPKSQLGTLILIRQQEKLHVCPNNGPVLLSIYGDYRGL